MNPQSGKDYKKYYDEPIKKSKFKIGQKVIASKVRKQFRKGYKQTYNEEPFFIHEIKKTSPLTFILKDANNEILQGHFYATEIQAIE